MPTTASGIGGDVGPVLHAGEIYARDAGVGGGTRFAGVMTTHTSRNHGMKPRDAHKTLVRELAVQGHGVAPASVPADATNIKSY